MLTKAAPVNFRPAELAAAPRVASPDDWLPRIVASDVAILNALYRQRRPVEARVAGHTVVIETAASVSLDSGAGSFALSISGQPGLLRLSADLVGLCARSLAVSGFDRLGAVQSGLLLELALLKPIKALEGRLGIDIRIEKRVETVGPTARLVPLRLVVRGLPTGEAAIELHLARQTAAAIARALDEFAAPNAIAKRLFVPIRICFDSIDLTLAELRTLRPGDIVLTDRTPEAPRNAVAVVDEWMAYQAERAEQGFRLVSRLIDSHADQIGEWFMQQPTDVVQRPAAEEATLEQLPIRLVFELGRLDFPLADIRRLAPGYVIPLAKPVETAVDITANGRKIGHGSLLKVGESVGVRIERLVSDDQL